MLENLYLKTLYLNNNGDYEEVDSGSIKELINSRFFAEELSIIRIKDLFQNLGEDLNDTSLKEFENFNYVKINSKEDSLLYGITDSGETFYLNFSTLKAENFEYEFNILLVQVYGEANTPKGRLAKVKIEV